MIRETMTRQERLAAAVTHSPTDRVPVAAMFDEFILRQKGVPNTFGGGPQDTARKLQAYHEMFDELGGWDFQWHAGPGFAYSSWHGAMDMVVNSVPGRETEAKGERQSLTGEDYDKIIALGWNGFCKELYPRQTKLSLEQIDAMQQQNFAVMMEDLEWWQAHEVPVIMGGMTMFPEMILSLGRTLTKLSLDVYRQPEKIAAVIEAMASDCVANAVRNARATGVPWANLLLARGSTSIYNLKTWERVVFPTLKKMVEAFVAEGLFVNMHMDTDWTRALPYFRELPKGKCMAELDSTTDIFKAREVLGGHICIKGDVPAQLLKLGTPDEVAAYCRKLIDAFGPENGFVLSTGCTCPVDAKYENVKAMLNTAKGYYPH